MKYYAFEMNERLTCDLLFDGQCSTHNCLGRSCDGILYHRPTYCPLSEFVDIDPMNKTYYTSLPMHFEEFKK
jgi:hypothetical protein